MINIHNMTGKDAKSSQGRKALYEYNGKWFDIDGIAKLAGMKRCTAYRMIHSFDKTPYHLIDSNPEL